MSCNTSTLYKSIQSCPGKKHMPGIRRRLYYVEKAAIANFPVLNALGEQSVDSMEKLAQLKGDFELAEGKYFKFIDLKDEASNVTFETAGENGSKVFLNKANAIVVGQPDDVKGFSRQALNDDIVYVYQNRDGSFCVLGNEAFTCHTSPSGDTGTEITGASTSTLAIEVYDECPVPTYLGLLKIAANTAIDCKTGQELQESESEA